MNRLLTDQFVVNHKPEPQAPAVSHQDLLEAIEELRDEVQALKRLLRKRDISHLAQWRMPIGKYTDWPLCDIPRHYLTWFADQDLYSQTNPKSIEAWHVVRRFLKAKGDKGRSTKDQR